MKSYRQFKSPCKDKVNEFALNSSNRPATQVYGYTKQLLRNRKFANFSSSKVNFPATKNCNTPNRVKAEIEMTWFIPQNLLSSALMQSTKHFSMGRCQNTSVSFKNSASNYEKPQDLSNAYAFSMIINV